MKNIYTKWAGKASISFQIERAFHKPTNRYLSINDPEVPLDPDDDWGFVIIDLEAAGGAYNDPGRTYGPMEFCYPPEGQLDYDLIFEKEEIPLTKEEIESLEELFEDACYEAAKGNKYD